MKKNGQSLIELLLAIAFAGVIIPVIYTSFLSSREGKAENTKRLLALPLLQDLQESARIIREKDWNAFAINGEYYPVASGSSWLLMPGIETKEDFFRALTVSDVQRDAGGAIVVSGGAVDPSTKRIVSSVWWTKPYTATISAEMYLTRYLANQTFSQSTSTDFNAGAKTNVSVTVNGEVTLGGGGIANWCTPQEELVATMTLPKIGNTIVATQSAAFIGSGDGTEGVTFAKLDITNPPPPATPSATIAGEYISSYKTNAIFRDGQYVYLATDGIESQVIILDTASLPYQKIGWIDISTGLPANGVYVNNNVAYVTSDKKLFSYDVSTKSGAHTTPLGQVSMWLGIWPNPLAKQVIVNGQYAFVGTANTLFGLQKFKISNGGATFKLVGVSNLTWKQEAQGLAVKSNGSRAYVAFNNGAGIFPKGFFIVNTSPNDPPIWWPFPNFYSIVGTYNTGATDPRGMVIVTTNKAIVVGLGGAQQYQVIDIANEGSPMLCGGLSVANGVTAVASVQEDDNDTYSYILTGEANDQFKIIQGGPGGGQYALSGTFESSTFSASASAAFNSFVATIAQPSQTAITFQMAVANAIGNSCVGAPFDYRGPDGTGNTYFGNVGSIPIITNGTYANPGQCLRYKAYLSTTNQNNTPILYDMTVNYSP